MARPASTTDVRVSIKTFGCRLNQSESAEFERAFEALGWQVVRFGESADAVVVHGCAVTATAEREGLRVARSVRRQVCAAGHPMPLVVLAGCVADAAGANAMPGVDLIVPRTDKVRLAALVADRLSQTCRTSRTSPPGQTRRTNHAHAKRCRTRALLKVQDGCDFFCTYCIVPHLRGPPISRPWQTVLNEAGRLGQAGVPEIVITGCNLACYRDGSRGLPELLAAVVALPDVRRVRIGSIEPATVERAIVEIMAECPKICRHLHLPLQSGDEATLHAMGRRYTPEAYAESVRLAVQRVPDLGVGADVIAGFPGERVAAFERTQRLIEGLPLSNLHVFPFSERRGTPAAGLSGKVPAAERKARAQALIALGQRKRRAFASGFVGRQVEALIEQVDASGIGRGWSSAYLECRVAGLGAGHAGRLVRFCAEDARDGVLAGAFTVSLR